MCEPTGSLSEYRDEIRPGAESGEPLKYQRPGLYPGGLAPAAFFAATVLLQVISVVLMTAIGSR